MEFKPPRDKPLNDWTLEDLDESENYMLQAAFKARRSRDPPKPKEAPKKEWHSMMGHLYKEALNHLPKAATGVIFTNNDLDTITCEPCHLTNSK